MILLPTDIGPADVKIIPLDFGGILEPGTGAELQRLNRLGNRTALSVVLPPLETDRDARIWVSRLLRGRREGVRWEWPLGDYDPGAPGAFVVDGASQSGTSLIVDGGTPRYAFREGAPFSLVTGGRHYLYFIGAGSVADEAGDATINLAEPLRAPPADGDALHLARPMIEGVVKGFDEGWTISLARHAGIAFEIHEVR